MSSIFFTFVKSKYLNMTTTFATDVTFLLPNKKYIYIYIYINPNSPPRAGSYTRSSFKRGTAIKVRRRCPPSEVTNMEVHDIILSEFELQ